MGRAAVRGGKAGRGEKKGSRVPRIPREPPEKLAARAAEILRRLHATYPGANCALTHRSPLELLVATILSAQCTDTRVNIVTKGLFEKYRTARAYAAARPGVLEREIHSTGFFRNKAKSIRGAGARIAEVYAGDVPRTMDELLTLPGVARKTANVVLGTAFGIADGVVVDTHVSRLSQRLGLSREHDPEKIERDLQRLLPRGEWIYVAHALIWHGRMVCAAQRPACERCPLADVCPSAGKC
ncbi:MAG: endonuclease III [Planctomycetales bacterium]|nr:endonuclease III [Planctomycetales bacterium]